jgi:hypothetical protein
MHLHNLPRLCALPSICLRSVPCATAANVWNTLAINSLLKMDAGVKEAKKRFFPRFHSHPAKVEISQMGWHGMFPAKTICWTAIAPSRDP